MIPDDEEIAVKVLHKTGYFYVSACGFTSWKSQATVKNPLLLLQCLKICRFFAPRNNQFILVTWTESAVS